MPAGNSPSIHRKPSPSSPSTYWTTPELPMAHANDHRVGAPAALDAQMVIKHCFALRKLFQSDGYCGMCSVYTCEACCRGKEGVMASPPRLMKMAVWGCRDGSASQGACFQT